MPMIPETALAMRFCARIGAVHSVIFDAFTSKELAKHNQDSRCKLIISVSCVIHPMGSLNLKPLIVGAPVKRASAPSLSSSRRAMSCPRTTGRPRRLSGLVITTKLSKMRSSKKLRRFVQAIVENAAGNKFDGEIPCRRQSKTGTSSPSLRMPVLRISLALRPGFR
ncbi:hypothetical protein K437DRAFT_256958 [Tilletiaria anomala UBC 951]|uniref:AMP-dependent synthetase/ligase domain-containing protein n=1 Tax=Tilletiaria anomala (strain ATCC 24038 / CBS 436.72 / UBC 951) TaxID=1037660 RepID=A0A066W1P4_TILAU|nr:uncharacterized protein K437DRAFT_256958 [Tilletiaria anomala UBC 951]KDN44715.1 hypothetical protein K437DRAFT_256958 [Tilletiaria anomala UBC 951]